MVSGRTEFPIGTPIRRTPPRPAHPALADRDSQRARRGVYLSTMRTFSLLLAVFFVIQGPLCALHGPAQAKAREASSHSSHDCCPEAQPPPRDHEGSSDEHHGAGRDSDACAVHCASLSQLLSSATPLPGKLLPVALHCSIVNEGHGAPAAVHIRPVLQHDPLFPKDLASRNTPLLI